MIYLLFFLIFVSFITALFFIRRKTVLNFLTKLFNEGGYESVIMICNFRLLFFKNDIKFIHYLALSYERIGKIEKRDELFDKIKRIDESYYTNNVKRAIHQKQEVKTQISPKPE
jgi:hypothetical protein